MWTSSLPLATVLGTFVNYFSFDGDCLSNCRHRWYVSSDLARTVWTRPCDRVLDHIDHNHGRGGVFRVFGNRYTVSKYDLEENRYFRFLLVEPGGIEPPTSTMPSSRSPS